MSMILLEPAYKILHTTVKFKRRTISVNPVFREPIAELLQIAKKMLGIVSGIKQVSADCEGIPWQPPPTCGDDRS
jgi:hypothetical protein